MIKISSSSWKPGTAQLSCKVCSGANTSLIHSMILSSTSNLLVFHLLLLTSSPGFILLNLLSRSHHRLLSSSSIDYSSTSPHPSFLSRPLSSFLILPSFSTSPIHFPPRSAASHNRLARADESGAGAVFANGKPRQLP